MLTFQAYKNGKPFSSPDLRGAYLVGIDDVPIRGTISTDDTGRIVCQVSTEEAAALFLLWPSDSCGVCMTGTTRLPERDKPYILNVELARARLMRIVHRQEEWDLFESTEAASTLEQINKASQLFVESLKLLDDPAAAAARADESFSLSMAAGEELSLFHARKNLERRVAGGNMPKRPLGCRVALDEQSMSARQSLTDVCDFVTLPVDWRFIEPQERQVQFGQLDKWVEWAARSRLPIRARPLVSFHPDSIPDWLYLWEHDFESVRDMVFEHIDRVVGRYGRFVRIWDAVSALNSYNSFNFSFDQMLELTRLVVTRTKQLCPRATVTVEVTCPWGEYYARNPRTIPPMVYADMIAQSGAPFDAFALQIQFGPAADGRMTRDLLQVAAILDRFCALGKPVHLTTVSVPSSIDDTCNKDDDDEPVDLDGGYWRKPWSQQQQAQWLRALCTLALGRPTVETIGWEKLIDCTEGCTPHSGLLDKDLKPKAAYKQLQSIRSELTRIQNRR